MSQQHSVTIVQARSPEDMAIARVLFQEYADSLDFSLCFQGFEAELATLPGRYAPPSGRLLLAFDAVTSENGEIDRAATAIGCVAMREISPLAGDTGRVCEMKRLYVRPSARGRGVGRRLVAHLLTEARDIGYAIMRLDTSQHWIEAQTLYASFGFTPGPMYNDDDHEDTRFFELRLGRISHTS